MPPPDDAVRLRHMLDAAREACEFVADKIHAYFDVDLDRVWDTVTDDLPPLIIELETVLAETDAD